MSRITCGRLTSHPSAFRRGVNSKCACVGIHRCVQIDGRATLPQATFEDQLPGLDGKFPPFECLECYEDRTIAFEYVGQGTPVKVFAIEVHLC